MCSSARGSAFEYRDRLPPLPTATALVVDSTPLSDSPRVSYPVSDSMCCRRRANEHGSEARAFAEKAGRQVASDCSLGVIL